MGENKNFRSSALFCRKNLKYVINSLSSHGMGFWSLRLGVFPWFNFSGYVPLATSSPGFDPEDEFGAAGLSDPYHIIRHFHISRNAPYLPPAPAPSPPQIKKLHNLWFSFFLGFIAVLREIKNNARVMQNLGKRRGEGGGKQGALWEMCKWRIVKTDLSTEAQVPTPQYG